MSMIKKTIAKKVVITSLLFALFLVPAVLASSIFFNQATHYIQKNCSQNKISDQTALLCYLFEQTNALESRITLLENKPTPTPAPPSNKEIKVFDGNNNELGLYLNGNEGTPLEVFLPSIQKRTSLLANYTNIGIGSTVRAISSLYIGNRVGVSFETSDCTGTRYGGNSYDSIVSVEPGRYFTTKQPAIFKQIHQLSSLYYNPSTNTVVCDHNEITSTVPLYELEEVALPITEPVVMPLKIMY